MAPGTQTTYDVDIADVEYLRHGDTPLLARLFTPRGSGPFPIMVELHGGAWVRGDRLNGNAPNEALAQHGVIVVALDFRVPPVAPYPASLADIHYGIRWCKTQAAAWHGRPDWIGAMGTSSGAHQAMLLGMRPHDPRYAALSLPADAAGVDGTLGCVIMCSPVIDPLGRYLYAKGLRQDCTPPAGFADRVVPMHDQYWQTEEAMAEAAPARILARGERTATAARVVPGTQVRGRASPPGPRGVHPPVPPGWWHDRRDHLRGGGRRSPAQSLLADGPAGARADERVHPPASRVSAGGPVERL